MNRQMIVAELTKLLDPIDNLDEELFLNLNRIADQVLDGKQDVLNRKGDKKKVLGTLLQATWTASKINAIQTVCSVIEKAMKKGDM